MVLLTLLWRIIIRYEAELSKRRKVITAVFLAVMSALQMIFGALLRYQPIFDVDAIYGGAIEWVETGTFASYYNYFIFHLCHFLIFFISFCIIVQKLSIFI